MDTISFHYESSRAKAARLGKTLGSFHWLLFVAVVLFLLAGIGLLAIEATFGWVLIGLAAVPFMVYQWWAHGLKEVPPARQPRAIDDVLDSSILGELSANPTPRQVAGLVGRERSGQFFGARFGITSRFLEEIASDQPAAMTAVWQEAWRLREQTNSPTISGIILAVALVRSFPEYENLIASIHLGPDDLVAGINWYNHLTELIRHHAQHKRTGGIARDWTFGYTPLLSRFGQNISEQISRGGLLSVELEAHQQALTQMVDTFSSGGRQNVALVGAQGSGKTSIVEAFAEKLLDAGSGISQNLKFRQVFILDSSALISAAPGRGELENLVNQVLGEAYAAKNIIICLDNAQLFFEEGIGSVDLSNVLLPILEAGRLRMILTMDEQRYLQIAQRNGSLANALNRVVIAPASEDETMRVMEDQLIQTEFQRKVTYTYQSLHEAYRLSERYVHELAMPGRALKLLESAAGYAENGLVTMNSVQQAIEQTTGVKVSGAGVDERERLLKLEELIHARMINQVRAVQVVSDALRRARAGVRNENRPIGTFLFLGPTGVGKTELAKSLADVYFGGEGHLVRLDLNEFVRPEDVQRLIADGANDPSSLTAQIMKQPFSVVLLDEIEKAHPQVLTALLQVLDEGMLRDVRGREISFRDAIIIATSNAGAERIREYIERGYQIEQFEPQFIQELIQSNQFRPEFLNRFDEIVTFRPLAKQELLQVVDLILAGVNKTLAPQKISVVVEPEAKQLLVERGYDPLLGARPMRRVVQRAVENTVAKQMLSGAARAGATIQITYQQVADILGSEAAANTIVSQNRPAAPQPAIPPRPPASEPMPRPFEPPQAPPR